MDDDLLVRNFILQSNEVREGVTQFKLTIPIEFVRLAGWDKGDNMTLTYVMGSGKVIIEKGA